MTETASEILGRRSFTSGGAGKLGTFSLVFTIVNDLVVLQDVWIDIFLMRISRGEIRETTCIRSTPSLLHPRF
ncbi:MAG: hypothetical protein QI197_04850 [Candidatus Korarchaeota archaeon]|nr:hypothetical protein [Candidatus Korarchaeota archaeon]